MLSLRLASLGLALSSAQYAFAQQCNSFGIDFQSGGVYFQNSESTSPFTALQEFEGCQDDISNNILITPDGDQAECSTTELTPDDTPRLVNCTTFPKNELYSGDWTLLIISNNGDGDPLANQRDFSLEVGPQSTETVTPTITVEDVTTPVESSTTTVTAFVTSTLPAQTVTVPEASSVATITTRPRESTTTTTIGLLNIVRTIRTTDVASTVSTVPASCVTPTSNRVQDPLATILPTILGPLDDVIRDTIEGTLGTVDSLLNRVIGGLFGWGRKRSVPVEHKAPALTGSAKFKREILEGRHPSEEIKRAFIKERSEKLKRDTINKRAPDERTITVTATSGLPTTSVTSTAPTTTVIDTDEITQSTTITPEPVTIEQGTMIETITITADAETRTRTVRRAIATRTTTVTNRTTITNYETTTSAGAAESCAAQSGTLQD
ncbi:hypothetical protein MBLNU230_g4968t1 [Neophaeotheca triangularis]